MTEPEAFASALGKTGETAVLDFVAANALRVEMGKDGVAALVASDAAAKPGMIKDAGGKFSFLLEVGVTGGGRNPGELGFNPDAVFAGDSNSADTLNGLAT